jgi:putative transposase
MVPTECRKVCDPEASKAGHNLPFPLDPDALWIVQQLREAWPYKQPHRFLLLDRDAKFGADVVSAVRGMGCEPIRTAFRSPWQNGVAERWVGSCRRDLLDHVIILNQRHLKRLMSST